MDENGQEVGRAPHGPDAQLLEQVDREVVQINPNGGMPVAGHRRSGNVVRPHARQAASAEVAIDLDRPDGQADGEVGDVQTQTVARQAHLVGRLLIGDYPDRRHRPLSPVLPLHVMLTFCQTVVKPGPVCGDNAFLGRPARFPRRLILGYSIVSRGVV